MIDVTKRRERREKPGREGQNQKGGADDIACEMPAQNDHPHHDASGPHKGEPKTAGEKPPDKEHDHQGAEGMPRGEGGVDRKMEREEDLPSGQGVMVELPAGMEGGKGALEPMFEQRPQHQNDKPDNQEEAVCPLLARRGAPPVETDPHKEKEGKLDLRISRAAEKGKEEIEGGGKTGEEPGDRKVEGGGLPVKEKPEHPQKPQKGPSREEESPSKSLPDHSSVSHRGIGRRRPSPNPAREIISTSSKARKKTPFLNLTGGPSPGSQSRGSVSVQQIRHMRGRAS